MRLAEIALALVIASASTAGLAGARQDAKVLMSPDPAALKFEGFSDAIVNQDRCKAAEIARPKVC